MQLKISKQTISILSTNTVKTEHSFVPKKFIQNTPNRVCYHHNTVKRKWFHCWIFSITIRFTTLSHCFCLSNFSFSNASVVFKNILLTRLLHIQQRRDETYKITKKKLKILLYTNTQHKNENKISKTENRIASAPHTHLLFEGIATDVVNILI